MTTPRVLFVLTSCETLGETGRQTGYFLSEVTHPARLLDEAGVEIEFASPAGGQPPVDPGSRDRDDADNRWFLTENRWLQAVADTRRPSELSADDFAAIFFAGGHGTMWDFPSDTSLAALTADIWTNGGVVAAVCHGPAALVNVRLGDGEWLVGGREVTSFTNQEEEAVDMSDVVPFLLESRLLERGARFTKAESFQEHVVVDGRLITGQNPASARGGGGGNGQNAKR